MAILLLLARKCIFLVVVMASEKVGNLRMMVEVDLVGMEKSESVGTIWNWNIAILLQISLHISISILFSILYVIRFSILYVIQFLIHTISDRMFGTST